MAGQLARACPVGAADRRSLMPGVTAAAAHRLRRLGVPAWERPYKFEPPGRAVTLRQILSRANPIVSAEIREVVRCGARWRESADATARENL